MHFLIETILSSIDSVEELELKNILDKQKFMHTYELVNKIPEVIDLKKKELSTICPVGTLGFVNSFLSKYHNIDKMWPIEVPDCLRDNKFLKRGYAILDKSEIPKKGFYFLKYASKLKQYSMVGNVDFIHDTRDSDSYFCIDGMYVLSEVIDIISEYRVIVSCDSIEGIQYYDGDCTVFPDIQLLKEMVELYKVDETRPRAYTMDIAVSTRGTCILEVHPFVSIGTYGFTSSSLPYMYINGLDYYIKHNKKINKYSNI